MFKRLKNKITGLSAFSKFRQGSYSQCGEDIIIRFLFDTLKIENPAYIDIGAHHPYYLNNTTLLYQSGARGINIEPDPALFKLFEKERKLDINLNIGISDTESEMDFYIFNVPTLNTLSKEEALQNEHGNKFFIREIKKIKVDRIGNVLAKYSENKFPDLLTLDAEGIDKLIIDSINFKENYPKVICIETLSFSPTGEGKKNTELIRYLESQGYLLYADTYINSIFVKLEDWDAK